MNENNYGTYQADTNPAYVPVTQNQLSVKDYADAAFSKALAAAIMCEFPIASIIAIIFGSKGLHFAEAAKRLAAEQGIEPGGKVTAAVILGKIGKIAGIVMTAFWGVYLLIMLIALSAI